MGFASISPFSQVFSESGQRNHCIRAWKENSWKAKASGNVLNANSSCRMKCSKQIFVAKKSMERTNGKSYSGLVSCIRCKYTPFIVNIKHSDYTLNPKSILHGLFYLRYKTILLLLHLGTCITPEGCVWFPVDSSVRLDEILVSSFSLVSLGFAASWARATHGDHIP